MSCIKHKVFQTSKQEQIEVRENFVFSGQTLPLFNFIFSTSIQENSL